VVVGLLLYLLLSRQGVFGPLHLLFTQTAMVIGQVLIALPVLIAFSLSAIQGADPRARETAVALGASAPRIAWTLLVEVRFALMAAVCNAFGRVVSEIGCSLMVGGNIAGVTRNIPTAIALETSKGEFAQGIALGIVLLVVALANQFGVRLSFRENRDDEPARRDRAGQVLRDAAPAGDRYAEPAAPARATC
jgi:tungstate transport system permease protein